MKILYLVHQFYPEYFSGTEKFIFNIASMSQKSGNIVKVISYSCSTDNSSFETENNGILSREYLYHGIRVFAFKYKYPPEDLNISLQNELLYEFAKKVIERERPDIIHVGHLMRVHEFIRVAIEYNIPYLFTLTDFFMICPKIILTPNNNSLCLGPKNGEECAILCNEFSKYFINNRLLISQYFFDNSKIVISPSNFLMNIFKNEFSNLNIHVINHGIQYNYLKDNNRICTKDQILVFGYAGNISFHKGVHVLLKAFTSIKNDNIRLMIWGTGNKDYLNSLMNIAIDDKRVSFCGTYSFEQLGDIFNQMDIIVTPSLCFENYPLVLHEALACNIPVIASNLGGMSEKIKDDYNGFTFIAGDLNDLKNKMELIIEDYNIINILKSNIRKEVLIPTVEEEAYNYYNIYNNIYYNIL